MDFLKEEGNVDWKEWGYWEIELERGLVERKKRDLVGKWGCEEMRSF